MIDTNHTQFTITIKLVACAGMKNKVLEEIKSLRLYVSGNEFENIPPHFDHAYDVKIFTHNEEI